MSKCLEHVAMEQKFLSILLSTLTNDISVIISSVLCFKLFITDVSCHYLFFPMFIFVLMHFPIVNLAGGVSIELVTLYFIEAYPKKVIAVFVIGPIEKLFTVYLKIHFGVSVLFHKILMVVCLFARNM